MIFWPDHGVYAIRYAGMDEMKQVEQWLAMNKAKNFEEWQAAIALNYIQSFNFVMPIGTATSISSTMLSCQ